MLFLDKKRDDNWLHLLSPSGERIRSFPMGKGIFFFAGELGRGKVLLSRFLTERQALIVDIEKGTVQPTPAGFHPLRFLGHRQCFDQAPAITLFLSPDNKLVRLDPLTLTFSPIFP